MTSPARTRVGEPRLFGRIRDESRLDQNRRDIRRLEHDETRVLDAAARDVADRKQFVHDFFRGRDAGAHARALGKVEQY